VPAPDGSLRSRQRASDADPAEDPDAEADPDDPDAGAAVEFVTVERNDVELSNDPDYYDDWSDQDALDEVENQGLNLGRKKKTKANVIAALVELVTAEAGGGGDGDEPDTDAAAGEEGDNYDDAEAWSDAELAAEYKKRALDTIEGKKNRAKADRRSA